jgi:HSP20 family molecular chaperone IbpA
MSNSTMTAPAVAAAIAHGAKAFAPAIAGGANAFAPAERRAGDRRATPWLPSLDLHAEADEMVVHAELDGLPGGAVDIAVESDRLILRAGGERTARLPLPFAPQSWRRVDTPGRDRLEVRLRIPDVPL